MAALSLLLLSGCQTSDMVAAGAGGDARYRHRELGYSLGAPVSQDAQGSVETWHRVEVERTDIAFRGPRREFVSVVSDCQAEAGRHPDRRASGLLTGVGPRRRIESGVMDGAQGEGWYQVWEASYDEQPVRIKTVTAARDGCVFDWILVSAGNFERADRSFETWRASFEPAAEERR